MSNKWSEIVKKEIDIENLSLNQIHSGDYSGEKVSSVKKNTQTRSGTVLAKKLNDFDEIARKNTTSPGTTGNSRIQNEPEDMALSA